MATTTAKGFWHSFKEAIVILCIIFLVRTIGFGLYQVPTGSMETTMLVGERFFADKFSYWLRSPRRGEIIAFNDPLYVYSDNILMNLFQQYVWGPSNWTKRVIGVPGDEVQGTIENGEPVVYLNGKKLEEPYLNTFPLIRVYTKSPRLIYEEVQKGMGRGSMRSPSDLEHFILSHMTDRAYDPAFSLEDQPYYRLSEDLVWRDEESKPCLVYPKEASYPREAAAVVGKAARQWNGSDEFHVKLGDNEYWLMGDNRRGSKDSRFLGPINTKKNIIHGRITFRIWSVDSEESWWILDLIKHPIDFWKRVRWSRFMQFIS